MTSLLVVIAPNGLTSIGSGLSTVSANTIQTQDLSDLLSVLVGQKGYKFIPIGLFGVLEQEDTIERSLIRNNDIIISRNNSNFDSVVNQIDAAQSIILSRDAYSQLGQFSAFHDVRDLDAPVRPRIR